MKRQGVSIWNKIYGNEPREHRLFRLRAGLWIVLMAGIFLLGPAGVFFPDKYTDGLYPSADGTNGEWLTLHEGEIQQVSFQAKSPRLKGVRINVKTADETPFLDHTGEIAVRVLDSRGEKAAAVYQSVAYMKENTLLYLETDAVLEEGADYTLQIEAVDTDVDFLIYDRDLETAGPCVAFSYLKTLPKSAVLLLLLLGMAAGVVLICWRILPGKEKWVPTAAWLAAFAILCGWWLLYRLRPGFSGSSIMKRVYVVLAALVALAVLLQLYFCYWKKVKSVSVYFAAAAFFWGLIYLIALPVYTAPDEDTHFIASYDYASRMMGMEGIAESGKVLVRDIDDKLQERTPGKEMMENFYGAAKEKAGAWHYQESTGRNPYSTSRQASVFNYFFQALGILIARLCNFNFVQLSMLGRLFNLLAYIALVSLAIKITPVGKWAVYVIGQFPMVLELSASYSYDVINIAMVFLFIAVVLSYVYEEKRVGIKDIVLLSVLGAVMAMIKGMYFPALLLLFLIPSKAFGDGKKQKYAWAVRIAILAVILAVTGLVNISLVSHISGAGQAVAADLGMSNGRSLHSVLFDPFELVRLLGNLLVRYGDSILLSVVGQKLAWRIDMLPVHLIIGFLLLFVYAMREKPEIADKVKSGHKALCGLIMLLCAGLSAAAMLMTNTPADSEVIEGVQGRYMLPFLPLVSVCMAGKSRVRTKEFRQDVLVLGCSLLNALALCYILEFILYQ